MSQKRLLVYVAGPFTAKDHDGIMANLGRAIAACNAVIARGHHPYLPHLTYYLAADPSNPFITPSELDPGNKYFYSAKESYPYDNDPVGTRRCLKHYLLSCEECRELAGQNDRRWVDVDAPWVKLCDAIYIMPEAYDCGGSYLFNPFSGTESPNIEKTVWKSKGAMAEYQSAIKEGKAIFWRIADIPQVEPWEGAH